MKKDMSRSVMFGVCAGMAKQMGIDPLWIRLGFILAFIHLGLGLFIYIILALLMEKE